MASSEAPGCFLHSTPTTQSHNQTDNVTQRRRRNVQCHLPTSNSFELLSDNDEGEAQISQISQSSSTSLTYSSLPNISTLHRTVSCPALQLNNDIIKDLQDKIKLLETKLEITENELDNQLSENYALENKISKCELKIAKLSRICQLTHKEKCTSSKSKSRIGNKTGFDFSKHSSGISEDTTLVSSKKVTVNKRINESHTSPQVCQTHSPLSNSSITGNHNTNKIDSPTTILKKGNVCILSSNTYNKTLSTFEDVLSEHYNTIHYLKSHCGIKDLLRGIESKVNGYTYNDYCVILLGDKDFTSSKDYFELISYIKEELQKIQHTNIILCSPTYKLYKNIFNGRVESFNNMLYWDPEIHEYAHILDTNLHLEYNHHMFRSYSGYIKPNALRTIFEDIKRLIVKINKRLKFRPYSSSNSNPNRNDPTFFRQDMLVTTDDTTRVNSTN